MRCADFANVGKPFSVHVDNVIGGDPLPTNAVVEGWSNTLQTYIVLLNFASQYSTFEVGLVAFLQRLLAVHAQNCELPEV